MVVEGLKPSSLYIFQVKQQHKNNNNVKEKQVNKELKKQWQYSRCGPERQQVTGRSVGVLSSRPARTVSTWVMTFSCISWLQICFSVFHSTFLPFNSKSIRWSCSGFRGRRGRHTGSPPFGGCCWIPAQWTVRRKKRQLGFHPLFTLQVKILKNKIQRKLNNVKFKQSSSQTPTRTEDETVTLWSLQRALQWFPGCVTDRAARIRVKTQERIKTWPNRVTRLQEVMSRTWCFRCMGALTGDSGGKWRWLVRFGKVWLEVHHASRLHFRFLCLSMMDHWCGTLIFGQSPSVNDGIHFLIAEHVCSRVSEHLIFLRPCAD